MTLDNEKANEYKQRLSTAKGKGKRAVIKHILKQNGYEID
jgi:hypothetical protein